MAGLRLLTLLAPPGMVSAPMDIPTSIMDIFAPVMLGHFGVLAAIDAIKAVFSFAFMPQCETCRSKCSCRQGSQVVFAQPSHIFKIGHRTSRAEVYHGSEVPALQAGHL